MSQLTFIDKIQVLFELLFSSPIIIGIFVFSLALMILLFFYSKLNKKIIKFLFIIIYTAVIAFAVINYGSYFLSSLDSFVTIFMANIYFPTIPVYVFIMLISFIIMIVTLSSKRKSKVFKIINTIFFTLIQMLFALFIYIVESNNIDVSTNQNLYTNEQTLTLLELGMGLFVIWIVVLLVGLYLKKADKIFKTKKEETPDDFDEYINDYNEPVKENKKEIKASKEKKKASKVSDVKEQVNNVSHNFNNSVVQSLVPELGLFESAEEEVLSFDFTSSENNISNQTENKTINDVRGNYQSNNVSNVFNSFEFLEVPNVSAERKNNDAEIIDFDS